MMEKVRVTMGRLTDRDPAGIEVTDLLAVDTNVPRRSPAGWPVSSRWRQPSASP